MVWPKDDINSHVTLLCKDRRNDSPVIYTCQTSKKLKIDHIESFYNSKRQQRYIMGVIRFPWALICPLYSKPQANMVRYQQIIICLKPIHLIPSSLRKRYAFSE